MPRNVAGRVYCGYSSRPSANDSSVGRRVVDRAGQEPDHRVDDDERRQLAAGQDVVADRQLEVDERADSFVHALVAGADEDEVRPRRRDRGPAPGRTPRRRGRAGSPSESSRRTASRPAAIGSGRMTIPAPPPYGASSTLRCRPRPHWRRSWVRIVAIPCSWIRPGMLAASGPVDHRREEGQDVDLEGHGVGPARTRRARGGLGPAERALGRVGGRRRAGPRRGARAPPRRAWPVAAIGRARLRRAEVERLDVDHDLAATRREDPDEVADAGHVELAVRAAGTT